MMLPKLRRLPVSEKQITGFGGYEHSAAAGENTFYDMADFTSDAYPLLSVRERRGRWRASNAGGGYFPDGRLTLDGEKINDIAEAGERLVFCTDTGVWADGARISGAQLEDISPHRHRLAPFGRNFMVYPDGLLLQRNENGFTVKHARYKTDFRNTLADICNVFGASLDFDGYGDVFPSEPDEGDKFLKTGEGRSYLYTCSDGEWGVETQAYLKLSCAGIGSRTYDGEPVCVNGVSGKTEKCAVTAFTADSITLEYTSRFGDALLESGGHMAFTCVTLSRRMPPLDFVCEHGNRLWGCRYGDDGNGNFVNEIYASALGEPDVWDAFDGISTDSYRASLGCGGGFTGICAVGGEVICFKESFIIRISGGTPSDFTVTTLPARGVMQGEEASLAVLNEKVYYRSAAGVTVFDGTLPYTVSDALGDLGYTAISAGSENGKYYIAAEEKGGRRSYLVYDTKTGLWHRESDKENTHFLVKAAGRLFAVCAALPQNGETQIRYTFYRLHPAEEKAFDIFRLTQPAGAEYTYIGEVLENWYCRTGNICAEYPNMRYVRGITLRLSGEKGYTFAAAVRCNNSGSFREICRLGRPEDGIISLRLNTPRCDSFELLLSGSGLCRVHAMSIITEGSGGMTGNG